MSAHCRGDGPAQVLTVGVWLDQWLAGKRDLKRSTRASYRSHINTYLRPYLGEVDLGRLRTGHIAAMFAGITREAEEISAANQRRRELHAQLRAARRARNREQRETLVGELARLPAHRVPPGHSTRQRIRATLRSAMSDAVKHELIDTNPAKAVSLVAEARPTARMWSEVSTRRWEERFKRKLAELGPDRSPSQVVKAWRASPRPGPAMVWTAAQTARFLRHATKHRLYPLYHLIAFVGLRRGEAAGAKWEYADLVARELRIANEILQVGRNVYEDVPKSQAGVRILALDGGDVRVLEAHRHRQRSELAVLTLPEVRDDLMFTDIEGRRLEPDWITDEFCRLAVDCGLPPIRLHDLRRSGKGSDEGES